MFHSIRALIILKLYFKQLLYLNIVDSLPDKYNDLMNLMGSRELRVCFPIQELNILLEPVQKASDMDYDELERSKEDIRTGDAANKSGDNNSSLSHSETDSDSDSDSSLVEVDSNSDGGDESDDSYANLANI